MFAFLITKSALHDIKTTSFFNCQPNELAAPLDFGAVQDALRARGSLRNNRFVEHNTP
jgi:hypothetical protein